MRSVGEAKPFKLVAYALSAVWWVYGTTRVLIHMGRLDQQRFGRCGSLAVRVSRMRATKVTGWKIENMI
jgi:hypothetical protein